MATRRKLAPSVDEPFSPPGTRRCFEHPDGRSYGIEVVACRVYESWGSTERRGGANTSTRDDDEDARHFALAKVRSLLKQGYVEVASKPSLLAIDTSADVIDTMRTDVDYRGQTRYDFQPVEGRRGIYSQSNVSVAEWMMTSDDRRLGVLLRCLVYNNPLTPPKRAEMASAILDVLDSRRDEIFRDRVTPLRAFPLPAPIGRFTRLVVLSPTTVNATISRNVNIASHVLAQSLYRAFPAYACEVMGNESVCVAEARCAGRGAIRTNDWTRRPHPVFDLAYLKQAGDQPKFLVFDPAELERRLGANTLAKLSVAEVQARNHAGEVRRFRKGDTPDMAELRQFFGGD
jgi:hypothetical protein